MNLDEMIGSGKFRRDLLHRVQSIVIKIPPLRKRAEDLIELIQHYTEKLCRRYGMDPKKFSPEFLEKMAAYDWPGNVRELIHCLEWSIAAAGQELTLYPKHLPTNLRLNLIYGDIGQTIVADAASLPSLKDARRAAMTETELQYLRRLMNVTREDLKEACRISGLSRPQLYSLMRKHRLTRSNTLSS